MKYPIQIVSKLTGTSVYGLRAWEKRYQVVNPRRAENGRRIYTEKELMKLWLLSRLVQYGFSIGEVYHYSINKLARNYQNFYGEKFDVKKELSRFTKEDENIEQARFVLMEALREYKLEVIGEELFKLTNQLNPRDLSLKVLLPLMQEVGRGVLEGKISISQEHAISALIKFHMGRILFSKQSLRKKKVTRIILATPSEEHHEFGIIICALFCRFYGIEFFYFGTDLPVDSLIDSLKATKCDLVILGGGYVTTISQKRKLIKYLDTLIESIPKKKKVVIGGKRNLGDEFYKFHKNLTSLVDFNSLEKFLIELN